jgi:hypothetical protein
MPKADDYRSKLEPAAATPPTLPTDFPDIPQNPSSELRPPPNPFLDGGKVEGTTESGEEPRPRPQGARAGGSWI